MARDYLTTLEADPLVTEVYTDAALQGSAVSDWLEGFPNQAFSFTDAVSFAVMEARGIRNAFTFDEDFRVAGFEVLPTNR